MREGNRRSFMTDCSAGAAALAALSEVEAGAGGSSEPRARGRHFCVSRAGRSFRRRRSRRTTARSARTSGNTLIPMGRSGRRSQRCARHIRTS